MDPVLLSQLLPVIGTVAGTMLGGLTAYAAGIHKSRVDLRIAEMNLQGQSHVQIAIDRDRQNRQKVEEAYGNLMEWLYSIESTIENIYSGLYSDDEEFFVKCKRSIDEWPWETLKAPKYTAATRYLWSDSVHDLLGELGGSSVKFTSAASIAYRVRLSPEVMRKRVDSATVERRQEIKAWADVQEQVKQQDKLDMWVGRGELLNILDKVRNQVRQEMLSGRVD